MNDLHRIVLAAALTAALLPSGSAFAQDLTRPLTVAEVSCNESQLEALLARFTVSRGFYNLLATYGSEHSGFEGTLVMVQQEIGGTVLPEHLLSFRLDPDVRTLLINPRRPPLPQVSLTRESTTSNLVPVSHPFAVALTLNPTLATTPAADALLAINNRVESRPGEIANGALATSLRPGRGLEEAGIVTPCHDNFTAFDRKIFALLQRIVRTERANWLGPADPYVVSSARVAILRDADPHEYRIDIPAPFLPNQMRRVEFRLRIEWTPEGHLTTGRLEMLPFCTATGQRGCSDFSGAGQEYTTLFLIPPVVAGSETWNPADPRVRSVYYDTLNGTLPPPVEVDFAALLEETAWN